MQSETTAREAVFFVLGSRLSSRRPRLDAADESAPNGDGVARATNRRPI
jgi:hypothetical protein